MERPKNFLFAVVLLSLAAVALAVMAIHTARERHPAAPPAPTTEVGRPLPSPSVASGSATPSAAAQKRAKEFNDATNRFNAPDDPPQ